MSRPRNIQTYLDHLYRLDYKEHPVSTSTLLCNKEFFGTLTDSGRRIFPIWMDKLTEIGREDSKYQIVFTGAIGTGKTRAAVWGALQVMQRIMCLKDPYGFFNLAAGGKMAVVFFNLTKGLSESRAYSIMQQFLLASPWFVSHGTPMPKHNPTKLVLPLFSYNLASPYTPGYGTVGEDVVIAIMDEVDDESSSEGMKQRILKGYDKTVRRFETRFVDEIYKESLGKFFLVSSKSERLSFLNTFIAERRHSQHVYVVDIPYWEARPNVNFSGRRFSVQLGDVYTPSKVITTSSELALAHKNGLDIIKVPVEYFDDFDRDVVGSLRDIAGVSVAGLRATKLFVAEKLVLECIDPTKPEPMSRTTIEIGLDDDVDLIHFLDISKVRMPKSVERFIHCDISYASGGDCMGLAMSGISHWTTTEVMLPDGRFERRKVPVVETDFAFRLKARPGDQIPLFKMRKFVLDLRAAGFNIRKFTADLALLSTDTKQLLTQAGIECDYISMDREIEPYLNFRDVVVDKRWVCHSIPMLIFELVNLEHDKKKQKVDHPGKIVEIQFLPDGDSREVVLMGSKDMADAVSASVYGLLDACDGLPMDKEVMVRAMAKMLKKQKDPHDDPMWFMDRDKAFSALDEEHVLVDANQRYWIWGKDAHRSEPVLRGPFPTNPLGTKPIIVEDPTSFDPSGHVEKTVPDEQKAKFAAIVKKIGRQYRR